jgi:Raffinose synthase or seed imbibition protein Sip1
MRCLSRTAVASDDGDAQSMSGLCLGTWGAARHSPPPAAAGALLKRLVLPDGSVLRAARPALPTRDTLFCDVLRDRRTLLKVGMPAHPGVLSRVHGAHASCAPLQHVHATDGNPCPTAHARVVLPDGSRSAAGVLQVWNMNQVNGLLFVANVQGASWDRRRRCFVTHEPAPPTLQASRPASHNIRHTDLLQWKTCGCRHAHHPDIFYKYPRLVHFLQAIVRPGDIAALAGSSGQPSPDAERFAVYSERTQRLTVLTATEQQQASHE